MKLRAKTLFLAGSFTVILSSVVFAAEAPKADAGGARVVSINGNAKLKDRALQVGEIVPVGDWIKTSVESGVKLLMPDRSIVDIGPNTQFRVQLAQADATDGQLEWGSVRASIQKKLEGKTKFRVRTKSSVLSARGTEFVVASTPKPGGKGAFVDQVLVKSGTVEMQAPGMANMMLDANRQVTALVQAGPQGQFKVDPQSIKSVQLSPEAMAKTVGALSVPDDTFRQVVVVPEKNDRGPNSEGGKGPAPTQHFGQDALAGANLKAANDPEGGMKPPPAGGQSFANGRPPPPPPIIPGLNGIGGSNQEKKLNEGVNVTVLFQL